MSILSKPFKHLRKQRKRELLESGMDAEQAKLWAHREATARQFAEKLIGTKAALACALVTELRSDGTYSIHGAIPESMIPASSLARARAWASMPGIGPVAH